MTHRMDHSVDEIFRQKLENYEVEPSPYLFDEIEAQLASRMRMRRKMFFMRSAAVFLLLIAFSFGYYTANRQDEPQQTRIIVSNNNFSGQQENQTPDAKAQPQYTITPLAMLDTTEEQPKRQQPEEQPIKMVGEQQQEEQVARLGALSHDQDFNKAKNIVQFSALNPYNSEVLAPVRAQKTNSSPPDWKLGSSFSRYFALQTTKFQSQDQEQGGFPNDGVDYPMSTVSGGIDVAIEPAKRLALFTGVYFARREGVVGDVTLRFHGTSSSGAVNSKTLISSATLPTIQVDMNDERVDDLIRLKQRSENIPSYGRIDNSSYYKFGLNLDQQYDYLEIPAGISFRIIDKKMKVSAIAGVSASILVNQQAQLYDNDDVNLKVNEIGGLSRYIYHSRLGLSIDVPVYKSLSFYLQPTYRRDLNSIYKDIDQPSNPDRVAVFAGFNLYL